MLCFSRQNQNLPQPERQRAVSSCIWTGMSSSWLSDSPPVRQLDSSKACQMSTQGSPTNYGTHMCVEMYMQTSHNSQSYMSIFHYNSILNHFLKSFRDHPKSLMNASINFTPLSLSLCIWRRTDIRPHAYSSVNSGVHPPHQAAEGCQC